MKINLLSLFLCTIFIGFSTTAKSAIQTKLTIPPVELKVKGNQVVDTQGKPVLLRGVNAASLEWSSDGEGRILKTIQVAIDDLNTRLIYLIAIWRIG